MSELIKIVKQFDIPERPTEVLGFGEGMINSTYKVVVEGNSIQYVLQNINHAVFKDVDLLQSNILKITNHIRMKLTQRNEDDLDRKTLKLIPALDGKMYYYDGQNYWRMSIMIPNSFTFQSVTPEYAYYAGQAFGNFQSLLADIPEELGETIPDFHNMEFRLKQFKEAVDNNTADRLHKVEGLVNEIQRRAYEMCLCERLYREGKLPKRINHCDTKVNNMLFDENGKVLCVIDLDTSMPGFVMSDFGDFMRSAGNNGDEDDADLHRVDFNLDIFKAYTKGYLEEARKFLTTLEIELLPFGAKLMTYMQLIRFLTDYLNGDIYYKIKYPEHNLIRSNAQFKLLSSMEDKYNEMIQFIKNEMLIN